MIKYINIFLTNFFGLRISKVKKPEILNMIKKWKPYDVGYELIRVGGDADGGYLAPDILSKSSYLFSPGCGNVFSFEEDMLKRNIKSLPHPKDQKNVPNKPDLKLEKYFYRRDEK